jgi:thiamine biosynthesis lipoprotein
VAEVELESGSLSTSGTSEHGAHVFDSATGASAPDFGSVSVWCPDATRADALSTALFVMGPEAALDWAARHADVEVVVLDDRGSKLTVRATAGLRNRLHVLVADVPLVFQPGGRTE